MICSLWATCPAMSSVCMQQAIDIVIFYIVLLGATIDLRFLVLVGEYIAI